MKKALKILMLEDMPADVELVKRSLKNAGLMADIKVVEDKDAYISAIDEFKPNLILSDHTLPQYSSDEAFKIYKKKKLDIPFILVTGTVSEEFAVMSIKEGIDDYILKSNLTRLPSAIKGALEKRVSERERKEAIRELEISEARNRSLIHSIPDMFFIMDKKGVFIDYKVEDKRDLLIPPHRFLGKSIKTIMPGEVANNVLRAIKNIEKGSAIEVFEYSFTTNKVAHDYEARVAVFHDDEYLVIVRDITARKRAEEELIREKQFLRAVVDNINVGIIISDFEGNMTLLNSDSRKYLGVPEGKQYDNRAREFFRLYTPDGQKEIFRDQMPIARTLRGEKLKIEEFLLRTQKGDTRNIMVNSQRLVDGQHKNVSAIVAVHDITTLKQAEERLKSKIQELDTFIYKASHDLKGPLASMTGLVNIAKNEVSDKKAIEYIKMMQKSVNKLDTILMNLIELTRITRGASDVKKINFKRIIDEVFKSLENLPEYGKINVKTTITESVINSDEKLIYPIFQNLIHNAILYKKQNTDNAYLKIKVVSKGKKHFKIEVEDNGIGIPTEIQGKVFDMFYRGHVDSKGTGLGLYIVKSAVERLDGTIEMDSREKRGTKFVMILPNISKKRTN